MADMQHAARTGEDPTTPQTDESPSPEAAAMTFTRLLANPRRIRRT